MNGSAAHWKDGLRSQLWPLPAFAVVLAVVLGTVLPAFDAAVDGRLPEDVTVFLFSGARKLPGLSFRPSQVLSLR